MSAKSKYAQHGPEILEMHENGKTNAEIISHLSKKYKYKNNASKSSIRSIIKRQLEQKNKEKQIKLASESKQEQLKLLPDPAKETMEELFMLFEEMEENYSKQKETALLQEKSLKNLAKLEAKHEESIEKHSILNETFHETIIQNREARHKKGNPYLITSGCILTLTLAMVAGYHSRRYNNQVSFHYIIITSYILGGVIAGIGIGIVKKKITAMWQKKKSKSEP